MPPRTPRRSPLPAPPLAGGGPTESITVRVSAGFKARYLARCVLERRNASEMGRIALEEWMDKP